MYFSSNLISPVIVTGHISLFLYYKYLKNTSNVRGTCLSNVRGQFCVKIISRNRLKGVWKIYLKPSKCYLHRCLFDCIVEMGSTQGSGHSSVVFKGSLQSSSFWIKKKENAVAIKVISGYNFDSVFANVITEELRNMSRAMNQSKRHLNVVGFYGACFQNLGMFNIYRVTLGNLELDYFCVDELISPLGPLNIVMELCENGSLDKYLVKMKDKLCARGGKVCYQTSAQLASWARQVANGMDFLAKQNVRIVIFFKMSINE